MVEVGLGLAICWKDSWAPAVIGKSVDLQPKIVMKVRCVMLLMSRLHPRINKKQPQRFQKYSPLSSTGIRSSSFSLGGPGQSGGVADCLFRYEQMVAELCLPHWPQLVCLCFGQPDHAFYRLVQHQLPGLQSSPHRSGKRTQVE